VGQAANSSVALHTSQDSIWEALSMFVMVVWPETNATRVLLKKFVNFEPGVTYEAGLEVVRLPCRNTLEL